MIINFTSRENCLERCQELESQTGWILKPVEHGACWAVGYLSMPVLNAEDVTESVKPLINQTGGNKMNDITTERTVQGWRVSAIVSGYLVSKHYIGYTKQEAREAFLQEHE